MELFERNDCDVQRVYHRKVVTFDWNRFSRRIEINNSIKELVDSMNKKHPGVQPIVDGWKLRKKIKERAPKTYNRKKSYALRQIHYSSQPEVQSQLLQELLERGNKLILLPNPNESENENENPHTEVLPEIENVQNSQPQYTPDNINDSENNDKDCTDM